MKKVILEILFAVVISFCFITPALAGNLPSAIVIKFNDNTSYKSFKTNEIFSNIILDGLLSLDNIYLVDRMVTNDVLAMEDDVVCSDEKIDEAVKNKDFNSIFNASKSDVAFKRQGDYLPVDKTSKLGMRYGASYIVHGSVDFIGGNERSRTVAWNGVSLGHSSKSVEMLATLRIIEAKTGMIIWQRRVKEKTKDKYEVIDKLSFGTKEFSDRLFYEVVEDISSKFIRSLKKDLDKGILIL